MNKIPGLTLRFKLSLAFGLTIAAAMATLGWVRYAVTVYRSNKVFDQLLKGDADFVLAHLRSVAGAVEVDPGRMSDRALARWIRLRSSVIVTDASGVKVKSNWDDPSLENLSNNIFTEGLSRSPGYSDVSGPGEQELRVYSVPLSPAWGEGFILHISRSALDRQAVLRDQLAVYLLSIPVVLSVSALLAWVFAGQALKPFLLIAQSAEKITFENMGSGIDSPGNETEVQSLVQSFNKMVRQLEQSYTQMRRFNCDAAHELRTPLAILQGENEIALRSSSLPPEVRSLLVSNLEELDRLTRIVNDMLVLAEAEAGTKVLDRRPVQIKPLLLEIIDQIEPVARAKDIRISHEDLPDVLILADRLWIRRAILNVLDNAITYSRTGGVIEILGRMQQGHATISVRDYGIGIAAQDLPRIFDRLYRADPSRGRNSGGAGLGLSLVRWIVEAHEGTIHVTSLPGAGTTFEIRFPQAP